MKPLSNATTLLCALLFAAAIGVTACGSPEKVPDASSSTAEECGGCHWLEESTVQKDDPGVGRHSIGAHPAGCYRETLEGMNTLVESCPASCCGK